MPKYLPAGLTHYVLNIFFKKSPPYHIAQGDVAGPLQLLVVEKITGHQSVRGRGGVIAVLYKTHWVGLSEPLWEREIDLQLSRTHIFRYWAGTPDQHRQTNRLYRRMRIGAVQRELSRNNGEHFLAPGRLRPTRGVASPLPRYGAPQGSPLLVQGRRWVVGARKSALVRRRMECTWSEVWRTRGRSSFLSLRHDLNGGRTRFLVSPGPRS